MARKRPWHNMAMECYNRGLTDGETAEICGVSKSSIAQFRYKNNLWKSGVKHPGAWSRNYHLFAIWNTMRSRCENPNVEYYERYGGRGITLCEDWHDANAFIDWAEANGYRSDIELELDRMDNNKGYSPDNCRWTSRIENNRNKRNTILITLNNETKTLREWAEIANVPYGTAYYNYARHGVEGLIRKLFGEAHPA